MGADEDLFDWEVRDSSTPFWQHAIAGSCAGVMEHVGMYPIDTLKTRIQASPIERGVIETFRTVVHENGFFGLMRGSAVIGVGCIPAHIGLFGTYEFTKASLLDTQSDKHQPLEAAACGSMATVAHDAILTPIDVVKQRLQLGSYASALDCVSSTLKHEGFHAFFRSLPTTLVMNVPYMGLLVGTNESLKRYMALDSSGKRRAGNSIVGGAPWYFLCAGLSGAFAATLTLPLDVVKTRLQTQGHSPVPSAIHEDSRGAIAGGPRYRGFFSTVFFIKQEEGMRGFFRGLVPRVALAMPAAAICWGTYELIKKLLGQMSPVEGTTNARLTSHDHAHEHSHEGTSGHSHDCSATLPVVSAESLEWEEWDRSESFWHHAVAGSVAGVTEHVAMYPVDTVKTRMQAAPIKLGQAAPGVTQTVQAVLQEQGGKGLMRGCLAIGAGCIPAHIALFCTYEFTKARLMNLESAEHQPARAALCGALATVTHDMIITPTDVVKQRLQLGRYSGTLDCVVSMWRHEGLVAFYRSLPTTLISECPFHGVLVASNESLKVLLGLEKRGCASNSAPNTTLGWHFFSTGVSGIIASVITQPLDVVKTRLQTQNVSATSDGAAVLVRYNGLFSAARLIHQEEGIRGFFRGTVPRLVFAAPSAAMCWGSYEVVKALLKGHR